jgi:methyl-accepting chemotaxis protein
MIASVSQAMTEQSSAAAQIAAATDDMRRQSDQASRGMAEQSRAAADISTATQSVAREIARVTRANVEQTTGAREVLASLGELRRLVEEGQAGTAGAGLADRIRLLGHAPDAR